MKPLLAILGSLTVGGTPALATLSTSQNYSLETKSIYGEWKEPNSLQALKEDLNHLYEEMTHPREWVSNLATDVQKDYDNFVANKTGSLEVLKMEAVSETIENTFQDVYTNNTPNTQTFQTQSYSKEVTNSATFTVELNDEFSVSVSASFLFAGTEISGSFSSSQSWTDTKTVVEKVEAPSQPFVVDPYSKGIASYVIKSGVYNVTAALRFFIPIETEIWTSNFEDDEHPGNHASAAYTFKQLVGHLKTAGYGEMIKMGSQKFSVISTDDPDQPSVVSLNIPINYISKGGKIDVYFSQEPIK